MKSFSFVSLTVTTCATIAVMWVRAKWATAIPEVVMCLLAAAWCTLLVSGRRRLEYSWVMVPLGAIVGLAVLQLALGVTVYPWPTRMAGLYWAGNFATFFVASQVIAEREARVRYLNMLIGFATFLCVFSTVQAATSGSAIYWTFQQKVIDGRVFGPFLYVNQYAAFVELTLPVVIYYALTRPKWRFVNVLIAAALIGSVIYSGSRGGTILIILELLVLSVMAAWRWGVSVRNLMAMGTVLAAGLLWVLVATGPETLISKASRGGLFSTRSEFNQSSLAMIKARPIQGFGLGNWATAYPGYASFDDGLYANQAHNDWAQWTVEGGIPMLILMLAVAVWAVPRALRSGWGLGVAIIFIHCLWDYPIQRTGVAIVFFTLLAAIAPYGRPAPRQVAEASIED